MRRSILALLLATGCAGCLDQQFDIAFAVTKDPVGAADMIPVEWMAEGAARTWSLGDGSGRVVSSTIIEGEIGEVCDTSYLYNYVLDPRAGGGFSGRAEALAICGDRVIPVEFHVTGTEQ